MLKQEHKRKYQMKAGHEKRFARRLDKAMPHRRKRPYTSFMMAASLLALIALGTYAYLDFKGEKTISTIVVDRAEDNTEGITEDSGLSLGDLSPDLRKIEQYYVTNINLELSELEISGENKALIDSFMERLATLNTEYEALNKELNAIGPNDQTINALINNLQLRLELLYKLKDKLDTLKSLDNDTQLSQSI